MATALTQIHLNPSQILHLEKVSDINEKWFILCLIGRLRVSYI